MLPNLLKHLSSHPMVERAIGDTGKIPEPAEGRASRIVIEEIPVSRLGGWLAAQDGGYRSGTKAQHGPKRATVRQHIVKKIPAVEEPPSQRINQHEQVNLTTVFHSSSTHVPGLAFSGIA